MDRIEIIIQGDSELFVKTFLWRLKLTDASSENQRLRPCFYSFQLNLAAMSLLALFCLESFLIYNFSMFSVLSGGVTVSSAVNVRFDCVGLVIVIL